MSSSSILPLFVGIFLPIFVAFLLMDLANGCGLPPPPAPAPTCCCGGGGGCGRKKREAVQPHYKGVEVPCPQTEWKQIMEGAILADDQSGSISAIQNSLFRRFPTEKFLVICASAKASSISPAEGQNAIATKIEAAKQLPHAIHFSSAGDGYCNVLANGHWCQAVALSA